MPRRTSAARSMSGMRVHFGRRQRGGARLMTRFATGAGLHACARLPVFGGAVVTMGANLPITILPGIVAELGRTQCGQLLFSKSIDRRRDRRRRRC
jgi:hypothetical protein